MVGTSNYDVGRCIQTTAGTMRDLTMLEPYRIPFSQLPAVCFTGAPEDLDKRYNGAFLLTCRRTSFDKSIEIYNRVSKYAGDGVVLKVIASVGDGWDHVSVSVENRCPTWDEMEFVAKLFFKPDEVAIQLHVREKDHINNHPFVLHWWRPLSRFKSIPLPPKRLV
jgi:hypothetical protein